MDRVMTTQNIRLSRVTHPRGTLFAMLLLVVVFLGFGVVAEACLPDANGTLQVLEPVEPTYLKE